MALLSSKQYLGGAQRALRLQTWGYLLYFSHVVRVIQGWRDALLIQPVVGVILVMPKGLGASGARLQGSCSQPQLMRPNK